MAKITGYKDIPLEDLVIGKGQVRTQDIGKEIDELAASIKQQGLLQPIVVCKALEEGKWEILTGQRRFLAHRLLEKSTITAAVLDERVREEQAKAISITENLMRRQLSGKELIDGLVYLFNLYGSARDVERTTGLPYRQVLRYVKYPRLLPELKKMVDDSEIDLPTALKAHEASKGEDGEPDTDRAAKLVNEMKQMSGIQQQDLVDRRKSNPGESLDDAIEGTKSRRKSQTVVTLTQNTHSAITQYAKKTEQKMVEAAATLIEGALKDSGFLEERD